MIENLGLYIFIFFVIVFILLLVGGRIINVIRDAKHRAKKAADAKAQKSHRIGTMSLTALGLRVICADGQGCTSVPISSPSITFLRLPTMSMLKT